MAKWGDKPVFKKWRELRKHDGAALRAAVWRDLADLRAALSQEAPK